MGKHLKTSIGDEFVAAHRRRRNWKRIVSVLGCLVAAGTLTALTLPAITMSQSDCGLEEHQHSEACYGEIRVLACNAEVHQHTEDCRDAEGNLTCGYADFVIHEHDDACLDADGNLVCSLPEIKEHQHDDSCYQVGEETVVDAGHKHSDACYSWTTSETPTCGLEVSDGHIHDETCRSVTKTLICTEEREGHIHDETCRDETGNPVCELEEDPGHQHGDTCYTQQETLTCEQEESTGHQHTPECYEQVKGDLICTEQERDPVTEPGEPVLICDKPQAVPHTHGGTCYWEDALVCEKTEVLSHQHSDACFAEQKTQTVACGVPEHVHTEECQEEPMAVEASASVSDVTLMIQNLPLASEIEYRIQEFRDQGDQDGLAAYCEKTLAQLRSVFDAYYALTEEQRGQVENAYDLLDCEYLLNVLPNYIPKPSGSEFVTTSGNVSVSVVSGGSLPGDAKFQIGQLSEGSAQFTQTQETVAAYLTEKAVVLNSMVLLDMHFADASGAEIECGGSTSVTLTFETPILPGEGTVQALHLTDAGIVDVTGDVTRNESGVTSVSLSTDGFSLFALTLTNPTDTLIDSGHLENGTEAGITWELVQHEDGSRTMTLYGEGAIPDFADGTSSPWYSYWETPTKIVFSEGITETGNESFHNWTVTEIVFPSTLHTISRMSMSYLSGPKTITIPGTVKIVEDQAFAYARSPIEQFILEEGIEYIGSDAFGIRTEPDAPAYIPASVVHVGSRPFRNTTAYVVHPDNPTVTAIDGVLFSKDGTILWDYPDRKAADVYVVPEHTTTLKTGALRGAGTTTPEFRIEHVIKIEGTQNFRDCGFQSIYLTDGLALHNGWMFVDNRSMQEVRLPENTPYKIGISDFGGNRQLASIKIPNGTTSIGSDCFYNVDSLSSVTYDAANAAISANPIRTGQDGLSFQLTVGPNVDRLPANFSSFVSYASEILFARDNAFYVEPGAFAGASEPLTSLSGWVYVAEDGALYTLDPKTGEAKLFYCQPDCQELTVPAAITTTLENGEPVTFQVTSVAKNALKDAGLLSAVTFEDVSKIKELEAYALANAPIEQITDAASDATVTTVTEAEALFRNAKLGYGVFNNTLLGDAPILGPGFAENMTGGQSLYIASADEKASIGIAVTNGQTTQWKGNEDGSGGYHSLTGDQVAFAVSISNTTGTDQKYRVYIQKTAEDCSIPFTPGQSYSIQDIQILCTATEDPNTICLEFTARDNQTVSVNINILYPSPTSPGGGVILQAALVTPEGAEQRAEGTIQASWETAPVPYTVQKENNNANPAGITTDGDGTRFSDRLIFKMSLVSDSAVNDAYGKDYVTFTDYVDTITLPQGVSWDPEVLASIDEGKLISLGGAVYLNTNPRIKIISIEGVNGTRSLQNIRLLKNDQGQIELRWRVKNTGKVDIPTGAFNVIFERRAFVVDMATLDLEAEGGNLISNTVDLTLRYTHTPQRTASSTVTKLIAGGAGQINIAKTGTKAGYLGEDITYMLRLYNNGGLPWESDQAGLHTMTDTLSSASFISADNMMRMLQEAEEGGTPLTITVQNAALGDGSIVTGTDGSSQVYLNGNNSDLPNAHAGTVTISLLDGHYTVTADNRTESGADLKEVLHLFGFGVAGDTVFTCSWALNDPEEKLVLAAGQNIERNIYATVKTTFQYIGTDWPNQYPRAQTVLVMNGKASVQPDGGKPYKQTGNVSSNVYREASLDKYVSLNGERLSSSPTAADGDVLDYTLTFTHYGSGTYDDLPMVDDLCGSQYLLVPAEQNPALAGLETREHNGTLYYVLKEGSFANVWVGQDESGNWLNAASITVKRVSNESITTTGSTNTFSGIHTQIKWYFDHLDGGSYQKKVTYPALIATENQMSYTIGNIAWMNDNVGSRIHAGLWGGGTLIDYDKQILVQRGANPYQDVLDEDGHSAVGAGESVTYRLKLNSTGNAGSFTVTGDQIADSLPNTYGTFAWDAADISMEAVPVFTGEAGQLNSVTGWEGLENDWTVSDSYNTLGGTGSYFLCWNNDVTLTFRGNAAVYLYVTLTYPSNTEGHAVWSNYAGAVSGAMVDNTFYVLMNPASVTHVLKEPGSVRLQKGVYAPARVATGNSSDYLYATGSSRLYYNNEDSTRRMVVYYATLYNGGASRLYLNDMQDQMPEGFTFLALMQNPGTLNGNRHENRKTITTLGGTSSPFVTEANDITYRSAQITANVVDGILTFSISAGTGNYALHYDEGRGQYYLDKDEAIVFGYVVQVGSADTTPEEAVNTLAMPYTDYTGAGLAVCEDGRFTADGLNGKYMDQNNGGCSISSTAEVQSRYGFTDAENREWLVSDVTMIRGGIRPGIQKQTVSYQHEVGGQTYSYTNAVVASDIVNWKATLYNNGDMTIVDYIVQDTMPAPYVFCGDVNYAVYDDENRLVDSATLFTVESVGKDLASLQSIQTISVKRGTKIYKIEIGAAPVKIDFTNQNRTYDMSVGFAWDENGNLVMQILMTDQKFDVPEGGRMEITYSSYNPTTSSESKTYLNSVSLLPTQPFVQSAIQAGTPVKDAEGNLIGVSNISPVTVATGYATTARKQVEEKANPANYANSEQGKNSIVLPDTQSLFTYTLIVQNGDSNNPAMQKLVMIDNLPYVGDTYSYNEQIPRNSEFEVFLAENPNFSVQITDLNGNTTELDSEYYSVQYSSKQTAFGLDDRSGVDSADWVNAAAWDKGIDAVRSIRIVILDSTGTQIPSGAAVAVRFDARASAGAASGAYAWNNFGYRYLMNVENAAEMEAMPLVTGVRIQSEPFLSKSVVFADGSEAKLDKDQTFQFLVYTGDALPGSYAEQAALEAALTEAGRQFKTWEITVPAGKSASEMVKLADTPWKWTTGQRYTIVEMITGQVAEENQFRQWNADGALVSTKNSYTFVYDKEALLELSCVNRWKLWDLKLIKTDAETDGALEGAVFALYSREDTGFIQDGAAEAISIENETWYLHSVRTTGADGTAVWEDLDQDDYYLLEVRAPDGYMLSMSPQHILRPQDSQMQTIALTNSSGVLLPETGGAGATLYTFSGWAMMIVACALMYNTKRKKRKGAR